MGIDRRSLIGGLLGSTGLGLGLAHRAAAAGPMSPSVTLPADPDVAVDHETILLRIAGDDGSASTIIPKIAANFLHTLGASNVGSRSAPSPWTTKVSGRLLSGAHISVLIRSSTTYDGYNLLAAGDTDIWLAGLLATADQTRRLATRGTLTFTRLARYAIVVVVHPSNPIEMLSYDQTSDIFTGGISDWREVGSTAGPITVYGRAPGSASAVMFDDFMDGNTQEYQAAHLMARFVDVKHALAADPSGIGYINLGSAKALKAVPLTVRGRIAARPDQYGLRTGDYPLANPVLLYRFVRPGNDVGASFAREALSPRSDYVLGVAGFEHVKPDLLLPEIHPILPAGFDYSRPTENSLRVSTTIRFAPGSSELDATARADVHDLARYLRRLSAANEQLAHLCYSEDTGDPLQNREISRQLGAVFANALRQEYFNPGQMLALGATLMLADDTTTAGRRLNRRVETWIRP